MDWRFDGLTALVSIAAGKAADLVVLAGNRTLNGCIPVDQVEYLGVGDALRGFRQPATSDDILVDDFQAAYNRIGGWLVLIAIGLVVAPVRIGYFVISHAHIFFDEGWLRLAARGRSGAESLRRQLSSTCTCSRGNLAPVVLS